MANIDIKRPADYKLYFRTSRDGNAWLDGKGKLIPLGQSLVSPVDSISQENCGIADALEKAFTPRTLSLERVGLQ